MYDVPFTLHARSSYINDDVGVEKREMKQSNYSNATRPIWSHIYSCVCLCGNVGVVGVRFKEYVGNLTHGHRCCIRNIIIP